MVLTIQEAWIDPNADEGPGKRVVVVIEGTDINTFEHNSSGGWFQDAADNGDKGGFS